MSPQKMQGHYSPFLRLSKDLIGFLNGIMIPVLKKRHEISFTIMDIILSEICHLKAALRRNR